MGYEAGLAPPPVPEIIDELFAEAGSYVSPAGGYLIVDGLVIRDDGAGISFGRKVFATGTTIAHQLRGAEDVAVFVCTAGPGVTEWAKRIAEEDLMRSYIIDALASCCVERTAEKLEAIVTEAASRAGKQVTKHYSPGHCRWPVSDQYALFSLLPKDFCGVRLTESSLMVPVKSISGIIGIGMNVQKSSIHQCELCEMTTCFRRKQALRTRARSR